MEMCYDGTLVMPRNYVKVTNDEMTYVEGGTVRRYGSTVVFTLNRYQCADAAAILAGASVLAFTVAGVTGLLGHIELAIALTIAGGIIGIGSAYMWYCSNKNGFRLYYNTISRQITYFGRIN